MPILPTKPAAFLILSSIFSLQPVLAWAQSESAAATSSGSGTGTVTKDPQNKIICKSEEQTGSYIRKKKTCLTKKQWEFSQDEHRRQTQELQAQISSERGN